MIDKGRIRRGPMLAVAGAVGAGALAAGIWTAAGSGSSPHVTPVAERNALAHPKTPAPAPPARHCAPGRPPAVRSPAPAPPKAAPGAPAEPSAV
ncbi:hypothetical protein QP089_47110, partial [Actinomadura sp. OS1-43]|nr:hypothetical protein [Actinomadura sp. OS1-43]